MVTQQLKFWREQVVSEIIKGWGKEVIFASNKNYCGKLLIFDKAKSKSSMHFHLVKDETWYVYQGSFILRYIDTDTAEVLELFLRQGDSWRNKQGQPHQLEALEDNSIIFEVSTEDSCTDNYRIFKGDSQQ
jgi:mannose-6-phosphate isomerase-like protein (cupin superfamily)